jgi:hypothetical protein
MLHAEIVRKGLSLFWLCELILDLPNSQGDKAFDKSLLLREGQRSITNPSVCLLHR